MPNRPAHATLRAIARSLAVVLAVQWSLPALAQVSEDTTTYEYDALGNPTRTIDALGHERKSQYDSLNRLIKQLEPHPTSTTNPSGTLGTIGITVDGQGQTTAVSDPRNLATTYTVDGLGNITAQASPDSGTTTRTFDAAGNVETETDARGIATTYSWDELNRITQVVFSKAGQPSETVTYAWDTPAVGRLGTLTDPAGTTSWSYDLFGRTTGRSHSRSASTLTVTYGYDEAGRPSSIGYPSGRQITYGYDVQGRIQTLSLDGVAQLSDIGYSPFGAVTGWTWAGGRAYSRSYDGAGRLKSFTLGDTTRTLTYDAAWRITGANDALPAINRTFLYDNLDRLTNEPAISRSYAYDLSGNRTLLGIGANSYAYSYATTAPLSNRLLGAQGPLPPKSYSYNEVGAITGDGQKSYAYNLRGRLSTLTTSAGTSTYEHNGLGQRTAKTVLGTTTRYAYDEAGHLIGEYDASGNALNEYVWLADTPVLLLVPVASQPVSVFFIHADQIDTPRIVQDSQYNNRWAWDPDGFGQLPPNENPAGLGAFAFNLRMPGQYFDAESGLFYNHFRDYDPQTGRYVESDPIGLAGGVNTYSYVGGNPTIFQDPLGLMGGSGSGAAHRSGSPTWGFFGCIVLGCVSSQSTDSQPQLSLALALGGGIEFCDPPSPPPPEIVCKRPCGIYDRNCDNQFQPPGIPIPSKFGGLFFGPGFKRDGRFCFRIGPHFSAPLGSLDVGGMSE